MIAEKLRPRPVPHATNRTDNLEWRTPKTTEEVETAEAWHDHQT